MLSSTSGVCCRCRNGERSVSKPSTCSWHIHIATKCYVCLHVCVNVASDVRRLIVAMSRARLGLYVFARVALFQNCFELTPAFNQLMVRPMKLFLAPAETYPPSRKVLSVCLSVCLSVMVRPMKLFLAPAETYPPSRKVLCNGARTCKIK